jgi:archaellum component FlaC
MGFIAEDVGVVVPEIVGFEDKNNASNWYVDDKGNKKLYASGVDYGALTPVLVQAIKELKSEKDNEILNLKETINSQNNTINEMKHSLCELGITKWC